MFAEFVLPTVIRSMADTLLAVAGEATDGSGVLGLLADLHAQG